MTENFDRKITARTRALPDRIGNSQPLGLILALLLAGACGGDRNSAPANDPGELGPYPVGVRTLGFDDRSRPNDQASHGPRHLVTEVWYPADPSARGAPKDPVLGFVPESIASFVRVLLGDQIGALDAETGAVRDAPIAVGDGPYPLIGLSHGNTSVRFQNFSLAEHLASHGFVVIAPDHIGNAIFTLRADGSVAIFNPLLIPAEYFDRVQDMRFLFDTFVALSTDDPTGFFTGAIALGSGVGMAGHSFGGTTTIAVADVEPRVVAAMPMAAEVVPVLSRPYRAPSLQWVAQEDRTVGLTALEANRQLFERLGGPRILAEFRDGGHFTFTDGCRYLSSLFQGDGCGTGTRWPDGSTFEFVSPDIALPLLNREATAFFRWTLKGETEMLRFLQVAPSPRDLAWKTEALPTGEPR